MKTLDEHLRDASQAWAEEATPTMVTSADVIVKTLRPRAWLPWGFSALGLGVVLAVSFYLSSERTTERVAEQPVQTVAPVSVPISPTVSAPVSTPVTAPTGTTISGRSRTPVSAAPTRLHVLGQADGFTAEYERVLGQAMALESSDPLRAVSEYMGLVRLCERREKYAHAVSVLERATILAGQIGDTNLKTSVDAKMVEIKGLLAP